MPLVGFPDGSGVKEFTCQCRRHGLDPRFRKILQSNQEIIETRRKKDKTV
jgi:hypothetical protein